MKKWFKYRDGSQEEIREVLAGNSEKAFLYAPMSYYRAIARERVWDGMPHVTDLFNGARMQLFKNAMDYAVIVDSAVWSITGLTGHRSLEIASDESEAGKTWTAYGIQGTNDHIETVINERFIIDSKFYGSFAVASKLGVYKAGEIPKIGPDGKVELYQKKGKWGEVGTPKTTPIYKYKIEDGESFDLIMQLNIYKLLAEENGEKIDGLRAFIVPRDGGTQAARQRGVNENLYMIPLPIWSKGQVLEFVETQREAHKKAMVALPLITNTEPMAVLTEMKDKGLFIPPPCSERECWSGRRCQGYCEVSAACAALGDVKYLGESGNELEDF